ncbi:MAG: restriction endonuclease subunit S [Flavobacteriaceae bacterium]|nr:restriction endonuclease subunit S [Flavobacteriaceae bacterium]
MAELKLIPQLRFSEFSEEWNPDKLGSIATFSKGKGITKSQIHKDGATECIRYGELYTVYSEVIDDIVSKTNLDINTLVLSEENDVIIPASGETQIDIATASCVLKSGIALGGDLNIIKSEINGIFLSYYLNNAKKKKIARLSQGISVVHLYASQLATLSVNIPSLPEQTKIATFLTAVDKRINLLQKKKTELEQYKKGVMQGLFARPLSETGLKRLQDGQDFDGSNKKNPVFPKSNKSCSRHLRFKQEDSTDFPDWEVKKLGEVLDYLQPTRFLVSSTEYKDEYEIPVLTAGKTFLLGYSNETEGIFKDNLPTIIFDDFTTAFKFVDFPFKAKSSAMKMLIPVNEDVNIKFIFEVMKTIKFPLAEHKRYWISEYQNEKIPYPSNEEQQKIATFLSSIDKSIENIANQIEQSVIFKKGLLQKMFV